jgi:hypothetical protein
MVAQYWSRIRKGLAPFSSVPIHRHALSRRVTIQADGMIHSTAEILASPNLSIVEGEQKNEPGTASGIPNKRAHGTSNDE